jgi:hypothetical protein
MTVVGRLLNLSVLYTEMSNRCDRHATRQHFHAASVGVTESRWQRATYVRPTATREVVEMASPDCRPGEVKCIYYYYFEVK